VAPGLGARGARVSFYCHGQSIVERPNVTPTSCFACQKHLAKQVDGWGGPGRIPMDEAGGRRCSSLVRAQRPKRGAPVPTSPPSLQPICAICLNKRAFLTGQRPERRLGAFAGVRSTIGCDLKVTVAHLHSDRDRSYCAFCRAHGGFNTPKTRRILDICK